MMEQKSKGQRRCKLPAEVWRRDVGLGVGRLHELLSAFPLYKFQTSVSVLCSFLHSFYLPFISSSCGIFTEPSAGVVLDAEAKRDKK